MSEVNIFEVAAKKKLRFHSPVGSLLVEQLYDLPLQHSSAVSLDGLAIATSQAIKDLSGIESFVTGKTNPAVSELEVKLEIIKYVIADKLEAKAASEKRVANSEKRRKILEALASKENEEIGAKSKEELLAELEALDAA